MAKTSSVTYTEVDSIEPGRKGYTEYRILYRDGDQWHEGITDGATARFEVEYLRGEGHEVVLQRRHSSQWVPTTLRDIAD